MNHDRISNIMLLISCAGTIFIGGVLVGRYRVFPYYILSAMHYSAVQLAEQWKMALGVRPTEFLHLARHDGWGVTVYLPGKAAPGLTFISGFFDNGLEMRLIRLDGSIVHRWPVRFSSIWSDPRHIHPQDRVPRTDWNTDIHGALIQPDGSVVFNFEYNGLVKLDRCGKLVWKLDRMTHHSVEPAIGGGFWVPGRRYVDTKSAFPPLPVPYQEDLILRVSDDGAVLQEISVPALLYQSELGGLFLTTTRKQTHDTRELVHLNDIEELTPAIASRFPMFAAGDLLVSLLDMSLVMVIEPVSRQIKWYQIGPWLYQHDPDFLPTGKISVFDNHSGYPDAIRNGSRIVDIDPKSRSTTSYDYRFFTSIRGKHQELPGGNLLITEFEAGRIFEVDRSGTIVWQFIDRYDDNEVAEVTQATRYPEDYFTIDSWACE